MTVYEFNIFFHEAVAGWFFVNIFFHLVFDENESRFRVLPKEDWSWSPIYHYKSVQPEQKNNFCEHQKGVL